MFFALGTHYSDKLAQIHVVHGSKVVGIRQLIVGTQSHTKLLTKAYTLVFTSLQQCPDFKSGMDQSCIYLSACYFEVTKVTEVRVSSRKFKHGWVSDAADSGSRCIFAKLFVECPCRWLIYKFGIDISIYEAALNCVIYKVIYINVHFGFL